VCVLLSVSIWVGKDWNDSTGRRSSLNVRAVNSTCFECFGFVLYKLDRFSLFDKYFHIILVFRFPFDATMNLYSTMNLSRSMDPIMKDLDARLATFREETKDDSPSRRTLTLTNNGLYIDNDNLCCAYCCFCMEGSLRFMHPARDIVELHFRYSCGCSGPKKVNE